MAEILLSERAEAAAATIMARNGVGAARLGAALGASLGARVGCGDGFIAVPTGPGVWLAVFDDCAPGAVDALAQRTQGLASIADQTGSYLIFGIAGTDAGALLQKGLNVDVSPDAFADGDALVSVIAHIDVIVWRRGDAFEVAVFRSYAGSFRAWMKHARAFS